MVFADGGMAIDDAGRADDAARSHRDVFANDAVRADRDTGGNPGAGRHHGRSMYVASHLRFQFANGAHQLGLGHFLPVHRGTARIRSEEHTSELQSLMRISYAVFCLKKKNTTRTNIIPAYRTKQIYHKRT